MFRVPFRATAPLLFALLLCLPGSTSAQTLLDHGQPVPGYGAPWPEFVPGTTYDPSIPTLASVVGHAIRDEITSPEEINIYLRALAAAAPTRTHLVEYARSWEGRPLMALMVGSAATIGRLGEVGAGLRQLADPRGLSDADAEALIADLPVAVALVHGVHGNEISSAGAAMAMAYHLLAARNNTDVDLMLRNALVIIDPAQNPDGRARFVLNNRQARGLIPDADPTSAEHDEPWPGGRVNHYLFDLNRDWFAQTQPESRGRVQLLLEYPSQVVADIHEMGGNSTYYFPPNAVPGNAWTTASQTATLNRLGGAMAEAFDDRGFLFFNRDTYDAFYPGYGTSWPMAHGAIGMTFEQASSRGLVFRRDDGSVLTYGEGVLQHFTAARATTLLAARERERMLREFLAFRREAIAMGEGQSYILHSQHDPAMAHRLATTLARNGIEVYLPAAPMQLDGRTIGAPAGFAGERPSDTYIVPLDQPAHRLIRNLLDQNTEMDADFVAEQVRRRSLRLNDQIYDVTAWSMPALWDVERIEAGDVDLGMNFSDWVREVDLAGGFMVPAAPEPEAEPVAWLMPWGTGTAAAVTAMLKSGMVVRTTGAPLTIAGRVWPVGTAIVRVAENGGDRAALHEEITATAGAHHFEAVPVTTSYSESGSSFGSNATRRLRLPKVLLMWEAGSTYSTGWARYVLEQRYGLPVTAVRGDALGRIQLNDYDVLVLPSGNYSGTISEGMMADLRAWMSDGGTVVTMAESSRWAARSGLLATVTEVRGGAPEFGDGSGGARRAVPDQPIDPVASLAPVTEGPEPVPGAILNVDLDLSHWLSAGTDGSIGALVEGSRIFTPMTLDRGTNVGRYTSLDGLIASGIVWAEGRSQLAHKAYLMNQSFGAGQLIAFAEDPNYRSYSEATQLLFLNAVLIGPGR